MQAATLEGLRQACGELLVRLGAGEQGLLSAIEPGPYRVAAVGDCIVRLEALATGSLRPPRPRTKPASLAVLFPGQGAQRPAAARWWIERPAFATELAACAALLDPHLRRPLHELLLDPAAEGLDDTALTQPLLVAFCAALSAQWTAWGLEPSWVIGHSLGEYTAAWAAGCCSREALLELASARGRCMRKLPPGRMAALFAAPARVERLLADLGGHAWLAADNGPADAVIAGPPGEIQRALELAALEGIEARELRVAFAAHGPAVDPALGTLAEAARQVAWAPPRRGWISTRSGDPQVAPPDAQHWIGQTREPVRFGAALQAAAERGVELVLELGPGASLCRLADRVLPSAYCASVAWGEASPAAHVLGLAAQGWESGVEIDWPLLTTNVMG